MDKKTNKQINIYVTMLVLLTRMCIVFIHIQSTQRLRLLVSIKCRIAKREKFSFSHKKCIFIWNLIKCCSLSSLTKTFIIHQYIIGCRNIFIFSCVRFCINTMPFQWQPQGIKNRRHREITQKQNTIVCHNSHIKIGN